VLYLQKIIVKENFMQIPKQSVKYISLQRTGYLEDNLVYKFLTKIENKRPFYLLISTKLKGVFFFERIKDQFRNRFNKYTSLRIFRQRYEYSFAR